MKTMDASKKGTIEPKRRRPPARTPEARENQLVQAAVDLAEKQLSDGTASAQVITHFLKLATTKERLEKEKLSNENELLKAKTEALQSAKRIEELYANALNAMRAYGGTKEEEDDAED
jgi:hypothetical protein